MVSYLRLSQHHPYPSFITLSSLSLSSSLYTPLFRVCEITCHTSLFRGMYRCCQNIRECVLLCRFVLPYSSCSSASSIFPSLDRVFVLVAAYLFSFPRGNIVRRLLDAPVRPSLISIVRDRVRIPRCDPIPCVPSSLRQTHKPTQATRGAGESVSLHKQTIN